MMLEEEEEEEVVVGVGVYGRRCCGCLMMMQIMQIADAGLRFTHITSYIFLFFLSFFPNISLQLSFLHPRLSS